jgi:rhodanese-related sulfurtransferase
MKNINQSQWEELIASDADAVILDVRTPAECAEGIIENAIMIDLLHPFKFDAMIDALDKNKNYYIYCRSGNRSGQACFRLERIGVQNTYNLVGGIFSWNGPTVVPA